MGFFFVGVRKEVLERFGIWAGFFRIFRDFWDSSRDVEVLWDLGQVFWDFLGMFLTHRWKGSSGEGLQLENLLPVTICSSCR